MQHAGCGDDTGEVLLNELEVGGEGAPASLETAESTLNQGMGLAQAEVKVGLSGGQVASVGPHEPRQKRVGRVPDEMGQDS